MKTVVELNAELGALAYEYVRLFRECRIDVTEASHQADVLFGDKLAQAIEATRPAITVERRTL